MLDMWLKSAIWSIMAFAVGACFGSFANVCIYRLPRKMSILNPPSHCTFCGATLRWYDLIPILSIILLLGKCRYCKYPIGYRHFFVELACALLFLASYWRYGFTLDWVMVAITLVFLVVAFSVDCEWYLIPDEVPLAIGVIGILRVVAKVFTVAEVDILSRSILGMLTATAMFVLIRKFGTALFGKEAMGLGDVKLSAALGLHIGFSWLLLGYLLIAIFTGAIVGVVILLLRRKRPHHYIPFGPFLAIAATLCLLFPEEVNQLLQRIYGLQPLYLWLANCSALAYLTQVAQ
jgi:leader peptidase (prepilin peptidase)/N-methyltransferase